MFIPTWLKPDAWLIEHYPFVRAAIERPVYYYFMKLYLIQPLILVCIIASFRKLSQIKSVEFLMPFLWFILYLTVFTYLGASGRGFQMRYLCPMYPSIYVMLYSLTICSKGNKSMLVLLSILSIFYAGAGGAVYLFDERYDEILSMLELIYIQGGQSIFIR